VKTKTVVQTKKVPKKSLKKDVKTKTVVKKDLKRGLTKA